MRRNRSWNSLPDHVFTSFCFYPFMKLRNASCIHLFVHIFTSILTFNRQLDYPRAQHSQDTRCILLICWSTYSILDICYCGRLAQMCYTDLFHPSTCENVNVRLSVRRLKKKKKAAPRLDSAQNPVSPHPLPPALSLLRHSCLRHILSFAFFFRFSSTNYR